VRFLGLGCWLGKVVEDVLQVRSRLSRLSRQATGTSTALVGTAAVRLSSLTSFAPPRLPRAMASIRSRPLLVVSVRMLSSTWPLATGFANGAEYGPRPTIRSTVVRQRTTCGSLARD